MGSGSFSPPVGLPQCRAAAMRQPYNVGITQQRVMIEQRTATTQPPKFVSSRRYLL
jgi:hypothetical protein